MRNNNSGGPAFPASDLRNGFGDMLAEPSQGMSLRDWFAGQALAGIMASAFAAAVAKAGEDSGLVAEDAVASVAYEIADAMLDARVAT